MNSPLIFVDPDGNQVDFADKDSKKEYETLRKALKKDKTKEGKQQYADLKRMEKSKDVTFMININSKEDLGANDGTNRLNSEKTTEENVVIDILVKSGDIGGKDKKVVLADELEHGRQFLDGEVGFGVSINGQSQSLGLDKNDEINSQKASIIAANALGISLNPLQEAFQNGADDFISKYYPKLDTPNRSQNLNSQQNASKEQLQNIVNDGKMGKFVYRAENKNVIIK